MPRIGHNMRALMSAIEVFGADHGRTPSRQELRQLVEIEETKVTHALRKLAGYGRLEATGGGQYVLRRTLDGRPVTYTQTIGST